MEKWKADLVWARSFFSENKFQLHRSEEVSGDGGGRVVGKSLNCWNKLLRFQFGGNVGQVLLLDLRDLEDFGVNTGLFWLAIIPHLHSSLSFWSCGRYVVPLLLLPIRISLRLGSLFLGSNSNLTPSVLSSGGFSMGLGRRMWIKSTHRRGWRWGWGGTGGPGTSVLRDKPHTIPGGIHVGRNHLSNYIYWARGGNRISKACRGDEDAGFIESAVREEGDVMWWGNLYLKPVKLHAEFQGIGSDYLLP